MAHVFRKTYNWITENLNMYILILSNDTLITLYCTIHYQDFCKIFTANFTKQSIPKFNEIFNTAQYPLPQMLRNIKFLIFTKYSIPHKIHYRDKQWHNIASIRIILYRILMTTEKWEWHFLLSWLWSNLSSKFINSERSVFGLEHFHFQFISYAW